MPSASAVENFKEVVGSGQLSGIVNAMSYGCPGPEDVTESAHQLAGMTNRLRGIGVNTFEMGPTQKVKLDMDLALLQGAEAHKVPEFEPIIDQCVKMETNRKIEEVVERTVRETGMPPERIEINLQVANAGVTELGPPVEAVVKFEDRMLTDETYGIPGNLTPALVQMSAEHAVKHEIRRHTRENGIPPAQVNVQLRSAIDMGAGQPPQMVEPPPAIIEVQADGGMIRPGEFVLNTTVEREIVPGAILDGGNGAFDWIDPTPRQTIQVTTNYGTYRGTAATGTYATNLGAYTNNQTATGTWHGQVGSVLTPYVHTVDNNLTYTINGRDGNYQYHLTQATDQTYQIYTTTGTVPITFSGMDAGATFTVTNNGNITWYADGSGLAQSYAPSAKDIIKQAMRRRLSPDEQRRRQYLAALQSPAEQKARDTLRDTISEGDWRRYVTNSFIMVKGPSGKHYQIFNDSRHLQVFEKGKNIAGLCIHSDRECPPTDHVINMKMLIEFDEQAVWAGSNISWKSGHGPKSTPTYGGGNTLNVNLQNYNVIGYQDMQPGVQYAVLGAPPAMGAGGGGGVIETDPVRATALYDAQLGDLMGAGVAGGYVAPNVNVQVTNPTGQQIVDTLAGQLIGMPATEQTMAQGANILGQMLDRIQDPQPNVENPYNAQGYALAQAEAANYAVDGYMYGETGLKNKEQSLVEIYRKAKGTKTA